MKMELPVAEGRTLGEKLLRSLTASGAIVHGEVLGSIRRQKPVVGDIELLLDPAPEFRGDGGLGPTLNDLGLSRAPPLNGRKRPWATRYYCATMPLEHYSTSLQIDVFVCLPPAEWGVLQLIRTGDRDFSREFVTRLHRFGLKCEGGSLVDTRAGLALPCDTEEEFFRAALLDFIPPELRDWSIEETRKKVVGP